MDFNLQLWADDFDDEDKANDIIYDFECFLTTNKIDFEADMDWNRDRRGNKCEYSYSVDISARVLKKNNNLALVEKYFKDLLETIDDNNIKDLIIKAIKENNIKE